MAPGICAPLTLPTYSSYELKKSKTFPVYAIKAYMGVEVQLHSFLTSPLDGDE